MSTGSTAEASTAGAAVLVDPVPELSEEPTAGIFLNATIVCVDEDPGSLEFLRSLLTPEGFDVVTFSSAPLALERIWERLPDPLIVDPLMVDDAGGELCKKVRTHPETCGIPIILHTAAAQVPEEAMGNCVCTKPTDPSTLVEAVRTLLIARP
jgi:CheY-like chemotaxis protein